MSSLTWQQTNKQAFLKSQLSLTLHRDIMQFMGFFFIHDHFQINIVDSIHDETLCLETDQTLDEKEKHWKTLIFICASGDGGPVTVRRWENDCVGVGGSPLGHSDGSDGSDDSDTVKSMF